MTDIVELLRNEMKHSDELCYKAADEIEKLRAAIKMALDCIEDVDVIGASQTLTKALGEKE